jgi:hypothetical protein
LAAPFLFCRPILQNEQDSEIGSNEEIRQTAKS